MSNIRMDLEGKLARELELKKLQLELSLAEKLGDGAKAERLRKEIFSLRLADKVIVH